MFSSLNMKTLISQLPMMILMIGGGIIMVPLTTLYGVTRKIWKVKGDGAGYKTIKDTSPYGHRGPYQTFNPLDIRAQMVIIYHPSCKSPKIILN